MAATDLNDLNNYEYHFETAAVTFLNDATGLDVYRTVIEENLVTPRIEIRFSVAEAYEPEPIPERGGGSAPTTQDYRAFMGVFQIRIITDNAIGGSSIHNTNVAICRAAMMRSQSNWYGGAGGGALTGTGEITIATTTLTGTGTTFTTELQNWDHITVDSTAFIVDEITSDTELEVTTAASSTQSGALVLSPSNLPYYSVKILLPAACDYEVDGDLNITQLNYDIVYEIRSDAWPS